MSLLRRALRNREIAPMFPKLAYSHFSGIMLNIPRLIYEGTLRGPASTYVDGCRRRSVARAGFAVRWWFRYE